MLGRSLVCRVGSFIQHIPPSSEWQQNIGILLYSIIKKSSPRLCFELWAYTTVKSYCPPLGDRGQYKCPVIPRHKESVRLRTNVGQIPRLSGRQLDSAYSSFVGMTAKHWHIAIHHHLKIATLKAMFLLNLPIIFYLAMKLFYSNNITTFFCISRWPVSN